MRFGLNVVTPFGGGGLVEMVCPQRLIDSDGFLNALGNLLADMVGAHIEGLVSLRKGEMLRAIDTTPPECLHCCCGVYRSHWYSSGLCVMKHSGEMV